MVGLMVISSKTVYATHHVSPGLLQPKPLSWGRPVLVSASTGDMQILKGRSGSVSVDSLRLVCTIILFKPLWVSLAGMGFDSKYDFASTIFSRLLLCSGCGVSFFGANILLLVVIQQQVAILEFHRRWVHTLLLHHLAMDLSNFSFVKCIGTLTAFISYLSLTFFQLKMC